MTKRQETTQPPVAAGRDKEPKQPRVLTLCEPVTIRLRRAAKCGDEDLLDTARIAEIRLRPGVDINYLVDAIRGGLASETEL